MANSWVVLTPFTGTNGVKAGWGQRVGDSLWAFAVSSGTLCIGRCDPNETLPVWTEVLSVAMANDGSPLSGCVLGDTIFFINAGSFRSFNTQTLALGGPHALPPNGVYREMQLWGINGKVYIFSGASSNTTWEQDIMYYTPETDTWTDTGLDTTVDFHSSGLTVHQIGTKVYMHPGKDGRFGALAGSVWDEFHPVGVIQRVNQPTTPNAPDGAWKNAGVASDGKRYALRVGGHNDASSATRKTQLYDYQTGTVTNKADHPKTTGIDSLSVMRYKEYFYTIGTGFGAPAGYEFCRYEPDVTLSAEVGDFSGVPLEEVEIEIELPEFTPPPLYVPHRGDFNKDPESSHRANLRALEQWANGLNDDNAYVWPLEWIAEPEIDETGRSG